MTIIQRAGKIGIGYFLHHSKHPLSQQAARKAVQNPIQIFQIATHNRRQREAQYKGPEKTRKVKKINPGHYDPLAITGVKVDQTIQNLSATNPWMMNRKIGLKKWDFWTV